MADEVDVVFFLNNAADSSIPLEIATKLSEGDMDIVVCSYFSPAEHTFDIDVDTLSADSQVAFRPYLELYRRLRSWSPDVLHIHPNATGSVARVVGRAARVPVIVSTEHSTHDRFGPVKNLVNGSTNWLNDALVANSSSTAASLRTWERWLLDATGTELRVIYNGVDIDRIDTQAESDSFSFDSDLVVGTVGRLVPVKNQATLVRAMAPLLTEYDCTLAVVGDGSERERLESITVSMGVADDVHFFGHQSRDEVYAFLHSIDLFVHPSFAEGFGVAVVEAMAAGVPPIVSDLPVMHEVVDEAGLFVDPAEQGSIQTALRTLLTDPERRRSLGSAASKRTRDRFPLESTVESYTELYTELIADCR